MSRVNKNDFLVFIRENESMEWKTLSKSVPFSYKVNENKIVFSISTGNDRSFNLNELSDICETYNKLKSLKTIDYNKHRTKSYLVALLNAFLKDQELNKEVILHLDESLFEDLIEGSRIKISVNSYERNPRARKLCLEHHGYLCKVCDFDFEQTYGEIGKEFIHVHHIVDLATINKEYKVDPINDLVPVCPNCHAMLHKRKPALTINKLRGYINDSS